MLSSGYGLCRNDFSAAVRACTVLGLPTVNHGWGRVAGALPLSGELWATEVFLERGSH